MRDLVTSVISPVWTTVDYRRAEVPVVSESWCVGLITVILTMAGTIITYGALK